MHFYFITGSSKGIGLAIVKSLLQNKNAFVVGFSRTNEFKHDRFKHIEVDFSDINHLKENAEGYFQTEVDAESITLVNNAGTLGEVGYIGELDNHSLPLIYNVNLIAPVLLMNTFIKKFKNSTANLLILNISSGAGGYPVDGWSGYCATKSAINMISEVVSKEQEIRESKIKIFSVAPGVVDTDMQEKIRNTSNERFSGVEKFINFKNNKALVSTEQAAEKLVRILINPGKYKDVLLDIREM